MSDFSMKPFAGKGLGSGARKAPVPAWAIGWDGKRPVQADELAKMAGVSEHRLWADRRAGLLGSAEPRKAGVRRVIYSAITAARYLKQKRPASLIFSQPPAASGGV